MKRTYTGLSTCRIAVECQPLMDASNTKIKVKTNVTTNTAGEEWGYEEENLTTTISESSLPSLN